MRAPIETYKQDYLDFCGEHTPDFSLMNKDKADKLMQGIQDNCTFSELALHFEEDLDQLAYCAVYWLSLGQLTRAQTATFLEYRSLKKDFPEVSIIDIDKEDFDKHPNNYIGSVIPYFAIQEDEQRFHDVIMKMPRFEACAFLVVVPDEHLKESRIKDFLHLAESTLKIITKTIKPITNPRDFSEETGESEYVTLKDAIYIGSMSIRDAIIQAIYCEHAKKTYPRLGEFTINMIGESVEKNGRYISLDYPSIPTAKSFHKIESLPTYVTLHDEVHRKLTSTIPNVVYSAFLDAINLVREQTGIKWSREIWDALDLEVGEFLGHYIDYNKYDETNSILNTKYFTVLLNATVYTERRTAGLFTASPHVDTTWMLLLDMVMEPDKWAKKGMDLETLPPDNPYRPLYDFILKNKNKIANIKSRVEQAAILKSEWLEIPYNPLKVVDVKFVKDNEPKKPRYIQIKVDGQPIGGNKQVAIMLKNGQLKFANGLYNVLMSEENRINGATVTTLQYILFDPQLIDHHVLKALPQLIKQPPISEMKDTIFNAIVKFKIKSVIDFISITQPFEMSDRKAILALLVKDKHSFEQLKWTIFELYALFNACPEFKEPMLNAILLFSPEHEGLISIIETNKQLHGFTDLDFETNQSLELVESIETLYKAKLLDNIVISTLLEKKDSKGTINLIKLNDAKLLSDENRTLLLNNWWRSSEITDALIKLNEFNLLNVENRNLLVMSVRNSRFIADSLCMLKEANLLTDKNRQTFIDALLKDLSHAPMLHDSLHQLDKANLLNADTINAIFKNPENQKAILGNILEKGKILHSISNELNDYYTNAKHAIGFFSDFSASANQARKDTAKKLQCFILGHVHDPFTQTDVDLLSEQESFLASIVIRCRENDIALPKVLEDRQANDFVATRKDIKG